MSRSLVAERADGNCASQGYSWFRCSAPHYFVGCCRNGSSPCDNGCEDDELDPREKAASSSSQTQATTRSATTLSAITIQPSMMSARASSTQTTAESPIEGTIVPDTFSLSTTTTSGGSTNKGGAIFQVPTTMSSVRIHTSSTLTSSSTATAAPPIAHDRTANNKIGPIVGGAVGGTLLFILAPLAFLCWRRRRMKKELDLHTMPYSVAVPFSVSRKPRLETMSSRTSDAPGFIHEKRTTADTTVERNDSTRTGDEEQAHVEQQGPVELPTHTSRTFLPEETGGHNRTPAEFSGPAKPPSPPSARVELPGHDLRTPEAELPSYSFQTLDPGIPRTTNISPVDPSASARTSTVSPTAASTASPNLASSPHQISSHIAACATFEAPCAKDPPAKGAGELYPGKKAYSPSSRRALGEGAGGVPRMQARVLGPVVEPVWPTQLRENVK
ncbi:hypothetical protein FKW77_008364 [Venturia effusa]|uniref:Epidermal growth factor receptor-like transmembrane-juxtamembrane segment domain-containing protein n=1 Tax=Venturia effusa TaxID=50376 RepID=A0A517LG15_9PEZI|nr:hypothetical protein FKW77_008364 [Venturia effusa]